MSDAPELARSLLVVDDDAVFRPRLARAFRERGFDVREAGDGESALALCREEAPELAVVDLRMSGMGGLELVREMKAIEPATQIVVLTGYGSIATALEAVRRGALHYLTKPADPEEILAAFSRADGGPSVPQEPDGEPEPPEAPVPSLARVEWEHIQRVLTDCEGNVSRAARLLGLHRRSLQRKLAKAPARR